MEDSRSEMYLLAHSIPALSFPFAYSQQSYQIDDKGKFLTSKYTVRYPLRWLMILKSFQASASVMRSYNHIIYSPMGIIRFYTKKLIKLKYMIITWIWTNQLNYRSCNKLTYYEKKKIMLTKTRKYILESWD